MLAAAFAALALAFTPGADLLRVQGAPQGAAVAAEGAVLRGLDKVAGRSRDIVLGVGESATFGRLTITLIECLVPADNPAADAFAHLLIHDAMTDDAVFRGWMIASSPALSALDHRRFDVWVIRCTTS
jgi:hypothetical protein